MTRARWGHLWWGGEPEKEKSAKLRIWLEGGAVRPYLENFHAAWGGKRRKKEPGREGEIRWKGWGGSTTGRGGKSSLAFLKRRTKCL